MTADVESQLTMHNSRQLGDFTRKEEGKLAEEERTNTGKITGGRKQTETMKEVKWTEWNQQ